MSDMPGMAMDSNRAALTDVSFTPEQVKNGGLQWEPVTMSTSTASATVPGQVVPNEDRTARLGATAAGSVVEVHVRPGDRVIRGQPLVAIRSSEAGIAQSDLAKARAEVASRRAQASFAKSARDRAERLIVIKAIPKQEHERAIADDELARAMLTQAEAELDRATSTAEHLGVDSTMSGLIVVRSPLAGVVLARTAVPGVVVDMGMPLVIVTDPATLWLSIDAPEGLSGIFRLGGHLRFTVRAFAADTFAARVDAIGAGLDPDKRTLLVRGVLSNAAGKLKPEMLATVIVEGPAIPAVVLPEDAVQVLDDSAVVFIAMPDERGGAHLMARRVTVGPRSGGRIAVIHGLAAGEIVVTRGAFAIKAQLKKATMPEMEH